MKINLKKTGLLFCSAMLGITLLAGCNVGNAPEGTDAAGTRAEYEKLDLDKKIETIKSAPLPPAEKEKMLRDAFQKAGKPYDPSVLNSAAGNGSGKPADAGTAGK